MSSYDPPDYVVSIYNPTYFASETGSGLTTAQASALFLNKTSADTATALETFTSGIATDSIATTSLASNMTIGSSTNTGTISISTINTGNTNASPAIAIGTDAGTKTIKINNNSNSVHCSSIDLKGSTINNITGTTGNLTIGDLQTTGIIEIGSNTSRTGSITLGNGTGASSVIIGSTSSSATVTIRNPSLIPTYTTWPIPSSGQLSYTYSSMLASDTAFATSGATSTILSITLAPGVYNMNWGMLLYNNTSLATTTVSIGVAYLSLSVVPSVISVTFPQVMAGTTMTNVSVPNTIIDIILNRFSGSCIYTITGSTSRTISLVTNLTYSGTGTPVYRATYGTSPSPSTYILATRIG